MRLPRINFKKGISLTEIKKLYPELKTHQVNLGGQDYIQAETNVQGVGVVVFIFGSKEQLIEFEILPLQQD